MVRVSWGLLISFKFIRLVLFTGYSSILEGNSCPGDQTDTLSPLGLLFPTQPSNAPRQNHTWIQSYTFSLAQHSLFLRIPMRQQMVGSPLSCPCHLGNRNHPLAFQAMLGPHISPGYGRR